jgi:hypothetical protein
MAGELRVEWDNAAVKLWAAEGAESVAAMDIFAGRLVVTMKALTPVSRVQPVYATGGATVPGGTRYPGDFPLRPSGYLRSSIHAFRVGPGEVIVGPTADYGPYVNDGTKPHSIDSHGSWPLRNRATGQVFGPHVDHPGTKAVHFIEKAAESMGGTIHV